MDPNLPSGAGGELPSLAGSRVTLLCYDREARPLGGQNVPGALAPETFAALVAANRISGISGRSVGDLIRTLGDLGGTAREQCAISGEGIAASYNAYLWRQEDGNVGVLLADVTGEERESSSVRTLSLELAHRTKNLLAVVLSLATQTAGRTTDYEGFRTRFLALVDALSGAHDVIAESGWRGAAVQRIVETCMDTRRGNTTVTLRPRAGGVTLKPNAVQNVAIVIRELQEACAESDAVSCEIGETEDGALDLCWSCRGRHDREGLWTEMLCRHAPVSLDGKGGIDFEDGGFRYRLSIGTNQRA